MVPAGQFLPVGTIMLVMHILACVSANWVDYCLLLYRVAVPEYWSCVFVFFLYWYRWECWIIWPRVLLLKRWWTAEWIGSHWIIIVIDLLCLFEWLQLRCCSSSMSPAWIRGCRSCPSRWWTKIFWTTWRVWVRSSFRFSLFLLSRLEKYLMYL